MRPNPIIPICITALLLSLYLYNYHTEYTPLFYVWDVQRTSVGQCEPQSFERLSGFFIARMDNAGYPQILCNLDKHSPIININHLFQLGLRNIQSDTIHIFIRLA